MLSQQQGQSTRQGISMKVIIACVFDVLAFVGGACFILTRVVFGPISACFDNDLYVADIDSKVIHKEYTGELPPAQKAESSQS